MICGQGPPPPNPQVVERFQQVISQLFQQVQTIPSAERQCCSPTHTVTALQAYPVKGLLGTSSYTLMLDIALCHQHAALSSPLYDLGPAGFQVLR